MKTGRIIGTTLFAASMIAALTVAAVPAANATQDHLSICHSGSGANFTFIEPASPGYNGHQNHDADIYGLTEEECLAKNEVVLPPPPPPKSVALYLYNKINDAAPAAWKNSGLQTLHSTHDGDAWFTSIQSIPAEVCGPGWAYQQDKGYKAADSWPTNIEYPTDNIGWPPIYAAKHGELSELVTVPDCEEPPVIPETPVPLVVVTPGEYGGDAPTCLVKERTWTRTLSTVTTTYTVELIEGSYQVVPHVGAPVITIDPIIRRVLWAGQDCPVDEPPVDEPPVTTPPTDNPVPPGVGNPNVPELPSTGVREDRLAQAGIGTGLLLGSGIAILLILRRITRKQDDYDRFA